MLCCDIMGRVEGKAPVSTGQKLTIGRSEAVGEVVRPVGNCKFYANLHAVDS